MIELLGWFGSALYLINHAYISIVKEWKPNIYYAGNFVAALSLVASSIILVSYQAVFINAFWAIISILLILKVDIKKVPFSRRLFRISFLSILMFLTYSGFNLGIQSQSFHALIGWSSSFVFCSSYFLFCSNKMTQLNYLLFNVYAACGLFPILYAQENWPVLSLEICWALISAYGAFKRIEQIHLID